MTSKANEREAYLSSAPLLARKRFQANARAVPYASLLARNAFVATEIQRFLVTGNCQLFNRSHLPDGTSVPVPRVPGCACAGAG